MDVNPCISFRRDWFSRDALPFWLICFLAAGIRIYHSFHFLISDEAFNLLTIESLVSEWSFHTYFFKHPPLYILLSSALYYIIGPYPQLPSYLSIFFSVASLIPFYLIADALMGKRTALWAILFLSVMPANLSYSTWIKQDSMLLFFFLWGIYFYLCKRFFLAGLAIGVSLLVKEFAIFFFPLSFLMTLLEGNGKKVFNQWRGWLTAFLVSIIISSWWYILYGHAFYLIAGEALTGAYLVELLWHLPWWFFFKNMPYDLSVPVFILFLVGLAHLVREIYYADQAVRYNLFVIWFLIFYIPLSFMYMKTPWFIYLATPSLAVISAVGLNTLLELIGRSDKIRVALCVMLSIYLIALSFRFDHTSYYTNLTNLEIGRSKIEAVKDLQGTSWKEMGEKKNLWKERMRDGGKIGFLEYSPLLQYLMEIGDERVVKIRVSRFMGLDRDGILRFAGEEGIGAFILNTQSLTYSEKNLEDLRSLWGEPDKIGQFLIFRTS